MRTPTSFNDKIHTVIPTVCSMVEWEARKKVRREVEKVVGGDAETNKSVGRGCD